MKPPSASAPPQTVAALPPPAHGRTAQEVYSNLTPSAHVRLVAVTLAAQDWDVGVRLANYRSALAACESSQATPHAARALAAMHVDIADILALSPAAPRIAEHLHSHPDEYAALAALIADDGRLSWRGSLELAWCLGAIEAATNCRSHRSYVIAPQAQERRFGRRRRGR